MLPVAAAMLQFLWPIPISRSSHNRPDLYGRDMGTIVPSYNPHEHGEHNPIPNFRCCVALLVPCCALEVPEEGFTIN